MAGDDGCRISHGRADGRLRTCVYITTTLPAAADADDADVGGRLGEVGPPRFSSRPGASAGSSPDAVLGGDRREPGATLDTGRLSRDGGWNPVHRDGAKPVGHRAEWDDALRTSLSGRTRDRRRRRPAVVGPCRRRNLRTTCR
jgi:hypothetical protein